MTKHLAGLTSAQVQQSWVGGGAKFPKPKPRPCPNCGTELGKSWKRCCSRECYAALIKKAT